MRVGSLFSGIGGFDLGLQRAGMRVAWHAEVDPFCARVLQRHWPGVPNHGDVRAIRAGSVEPVEVLCGGFPCQDLSRAGKGAGLAGERSGLWFEFSRLIRDLGPRWCLVENVPDLRDRGYDRLADDLDAAAYTTLAFLVGADDIGAPHIRKRAWIVAYSDAVRCAGREVDGLFARERALRRDDADRRTLARLAPHTECERLERQFPARPAPASIDGPRHGGHPFWRETQPPVPELDDGVPAGLVRYRRHALSAIGNALLPQIAESIGRTIIRIERAISA